MNGSLRFAASVAGFSCVLSACTENPAGPPRFLEPSLAAASAASVSQGSSETPFGGVALTCAGEVVNMAGIIVSRWHITQLSAGDWMLTQHDVISANGDGVLTGASYVRRGNSNTTQVFAAPFHGAFTYTQVFRIRNIVQGGADNDAFLVHAKWTINAAGEVSVDVFKVESECRG